MIYFGGVFIALGFTMWARGMIYTLRPQGKIAEKRKRKNLKYGFTTDMKVFGRKIRRLGFMLTLLGALAVAWTTSGEVEESLAQAADPTENSIEGNAGPDNALQEAAPASDALPNGVSEDSKE